MERTPSTKFLCWWFGVSYPCALVMVLRFEAPLISVDPFEGAFEGSLRIFEGAFEQGTKRKSRFGANHSSKNPCCSMVPLQNHARQAQVQTLDGYGSTQNEHGRKLSAVPTGHLLLLLSLPPRPLLLLLAPGMQKNRQGAEMAVSWAKPLLHVQAIVETTFSGGLPWEGSS